MLSDAESDMMASTQSSIPKRFKSNLIECITQLCMNYIYFEMNLRILGSISISIDNGKLQTTFVLNETFDKNELFPAFSLESDCQTPEYVIDTSISHQRFSDSANDKSSYPGGTSNHGSVFDDDFNRDSDTGVQDEFISPNAWYSQSRIYTETATGTYCDSVDADKTVAKVTNRTGNEIKQKSTTYTHWAIDDCRQLTELLPHEVNIKTAHSNGDVCLRNVQEFADTSLQSSALSQSFQQKWHGYNLPAHLEPHPAEHCQNIGVQATCTPTGDKVGVILTNTERAMPCTSLKTDVICSDSKVHKIHTSIELLESEKYLSSTSISVESKIKDVLANDEILIGKESAGMNIDSICSECEKVYSSAAKLKDHERQCHTSILLNIRCDICNDKFKNRGSLKKHKRSEHGDGHRYQCTFPGCNVNFKHQPSLKMHMLKHSGARPYQCSMCAKSYLSAGHLHAHQQSNHMPSKYTCKVCGKKFRYPNSLRYHEKLHSTETRPFCCAVCGKGFLNKTVLASHSNVHITVCKYQCEICNRRYKTEALRRMHVDTHSGNKKIRYICKICKRGFVYQSTLDTHVQVHSNDKHYECTKCGKTFKLYSTLYGHLQSHRTDVTFCCPICDKKFKTRSCCRAHEKRHSNQKAHLCNICGKTFSARGDLQKHQKYIHDNNSKFSCTICGKETARADNLRAHMRRVHNMRNISLDDIRNS